MTTIEAWSTVFFDESGSVVIAGRGEYFASKCSAHFDYGIVTDIDAANRILKAPKHTGMFLCSLEVDAYIVQNYSASL